MQEDSYEKDQSEKWHGNEEQMNIYVYHMLQSCGAQAGSYLKTEVINETHPLGLLQLPNSTSNAKDKSLEKHKKCKMAWE